MEKRKAKQTTDFVLVIDAPKDNHKQKGGETTTAAPC
jgi:hypothetical protein